MAKTNKDAAFGLRAIGKVGQNRDNQGLGEYSISSGDTTKIFFQDAVSATAAGTIPVSYTHLTLPTTPYV